MRVNDFFDHVFIVNLRRRLDRLIEITKELEKHNIEAEVIEAIDGNDLELPEIISSDGLRVKKGDIGCSLSHSKVCKIAKERGFKNYLVIEDDCQMKSNFNELFTEYIMQVPSDWKLLYIGGSHNGNKSHVSKNIVLAQKIFTTHAMGVHEEVYDDLINLWEQRNEKVDLCVAQLQEKYVTYAFEPFIIGQRPSYSDILNKYTDYKHLRV